MPVDFSVHTETELSMAIELAKESKGRIHLVHVYAMPSTMATDYGIPIPPSHVQRARLSILPSTSRAVVATSPVRPIGNEPRISRHASASEQPTVFHGARGISVHATGDLWKPTGGGRRLAGHRRGVHG